MAGFQVASGGRFYPTHHDARYCKVVVVHYPLHPFFGRGELPVTRRRGYGHVQYVEVEVHGVQQSVPFWMTDESFCRRLTIGLTPYCSSTALLELLDLLRSTGL